MKLRFGLRQCSMSERGALGCIDLYGWRSIKACTYKQIIRPVHVCTCILVIYRESNIVKIVRVNNNEGKRGRHKYFNVMAGKTWNLKLPVVPFTESVLGFQMFYFAYLFLFFRKEQVDTPENIHFKTSRLSTTKSVVQNDDAQLCLCLFL